ncbi:hypothetical protein JXL19_07740 [bacterium]|nr:hypothetical protein [bacterium]
MKTTPLGKGYGNLFSKTKKAVPGYSHRNDVVVVQNKAISASATINALFYPRKKVIFTMKFPPKIPKSSDRDHGRRRDRREENMPTLVGGDSGAGTLVADMNPC